MVHADSRNGTRSDYTIWRWQVKFQDMFQQMTLKDGNDGIDPFEACITIASACNLVYRTNFLQTESIGIIPSHGYRPEDKQSTKALQWLKCIAASEGLKIQHAKNRDEKLIGLYKVLTRIFQREPDATSYWNYMDVSGTDVRNRIPRLRWTPSLIPPWPTFTC